MNKGMFSRILVSATLLAVFSAFVAWQAWPGEPYEHTAASVQARVNQSWGQLPLSFEANEGQTDSHVDFLSRGEGYTLFLKPTEAVLSLKKASGDQNNPGLVTAADGGLSGSEPKINSPSVLSMQILGANASAKVSGIDQLPGKTNYFIGNDPAQWRTNIANFAKVQYRDVYPGIDLDYYGNQRQVEYDFIVAPGSDPSVINLRACVKSARNLPS